MRCVSCGCDKDAGAFSGPQTKKPVAKRKCISSTAAATGDGSVATSSSSAVSVSAAQREASAADTRSSGTSKAAATAATVATMPPALSRVCGANTRVRAESSSPATASHQNWQRCSRCKQAFYGCTECQHEHWKRGGHKQPLWPTIASRRSMAARNASTSTGSRAGTSSHCGPRLQVVWY